MLKKKHGLTMKYGEDEVSIRVSGEIDHHNAVLVRTSIDAELSQKRPHQVFLVLSDVQFMDSSGLGLIMGRYALVKRYGGTLTVCNPSRAVVKIIKLAGMDRLVPIQVKKEKKDEEKV